MKKVPVALVLILAALGLAACGSSSSSSSESTPAETTAEAPAESGGGAEAEGGTAGASTLDIETAPSGLAFSSKSADATAGKVTVDFTNAQAIPHNVEIEDSSGKVIGETETIAEGSESFEADLKPGTYTFFCDVPGHREAGMEGTLTVK